MTISVLLADDHEFFRSGFRAALETQPDLECVADVGDGRAAVRRCRELAPDIAVLDVRMPLLDGLAAAELILATDSPTRILLLTTYDDDTYLYRALQAGASGFLLKSMPTEELLGAHPGRRPRRCTHRPLGHPTPDCPPRRRAGPHPRATAPGAADRPRAGDPAGTGRGRSNAEIAAVLFVGEQTVKTHVSRVLTKLDLRDRVQAVVYVHEHRLLNPDPKERS